MYELEDRGCLGTSLNQISAIFASICFFLKELKRAELLMILAHLIKIVGTHNKIDV